LAELPADKEKLQVAQIRAGLFEQGKIQNPNQPRTRYGQSVHHDGTLVNFFQPNSVKPAPDREPRRMNPSVKFSA
jgi:hypothetical protein